MLKRIVKNVIREEYVLKAILRRIGVGKATRYVKDWDKFKKYI